MKIEWFIPRACPTVNDWHGGPRWKYANLRSLWLREFPPSSIYRARGPRKVTIVRVYPQTKGQRRYDPDNLRGGAKPILDALVAHGWLKGDSPKHLTLDVTQRHAEPGEKPPKTIVTVEDAQEGRDVGGPTYRPS
jgi:hypothetical protein